MSRSITFPVVSKGVRRNAETGVEIRSTKLDRGGMEHSVYAPDRRTRDGMRLVDYYGDLASARDEAIGQAERVRQIRHDDHSDAITENAQRATAATLTERGFAAEGRDWRHAKTGVEIIAGEFLGEPVETYEVRIPHDNKYGYFVVLNADTLAEAADEALGQAYGIEMSAPDPEAAAELTEYARKQFSTEHSSRKNVAKVDDRGMHMGPGHVAPATIERAVAAALVEHSERFPSPVPPIVD